MYEKQFKGKGQPTKPFRFLFKESKFFQGGIPATVYVYRIMFNI